MGLGVGDWNLNGDRVSVGSRARFSARSLTLSLPQNPQPTGVAQREEPAAGRHLRAGENIRKVGVQVAVQRRKQIDELGHDCPIRDLPLDLARGEHDLETVQRSGGGES